MDASTKAELLRAASVGDSANLGRLVGRPDVDVNAPLDGDGSFALLCAAKGGHLQCVSGLLQIQQCAAAIDVAEHKHGMTPLAMAAFGGHAEVVWSLCAARANPALTDKSGTTPLHWAAYCGSADAVRSLLYANASPTVRDEDGTPADTALAKGQTQCAVLLQCATHASSGGALPQVRLNVENRTTAAARMCFVSWCDPREQPLGQLDASSARQGVVSVGDEVRLYSTSTGERLASHFVTAAAPDPQLVVCALPAGSSSSAAAAAGSGGGSGDLGWEWEDSYVGSGKWTAYDSVIGARIAASLSAGVTKFDVQLGSRSPPDTYTIDLGRRRQTNHRTGFVRALRQRQSQQGAAGASPSLPAASPPPPPPPPPPPLASSVFVPAAAAGQLLDGFPGGFDQPPPYWGHGTQVQGESGGAHTTLRELSATSPIFHEVLARVAASGQELASLRVRSIYLAENASRFDQYAAAKRAFERRLGSGNSGERWLWHGTERGKVAPILANGFLRDYNKRGAYGCGVYFASQASYSLSSTYARPDDASGDQFLLLVRVLVGEACVGRASMDRPAPKPNSVELYDSMVESLDRTPSIVVLSAGSDNRAYPEFVLCVQRVRT